MLLMTWRSCSLFGKGTILDVLGIESTLMRKKTQQLLITWRTNLLLILLLLKSLSSRWCLRPRKRRFKRVFRFIILVQGVRYISCLCFSFHVLFIFLFVYFSFFMFLLWVWLLSPVLLRFFYLRRFWFLSPFSFCFSFRYYNI